MAYIKKDKISGYIIDTAMLIFERSDGKIVVMNNGSGGSVSSTKENVTISNGWISSPQAVIDTTSTTTISYQTNLTDMQMIAGVTNTTVATENSTVRTAEVYEVQSVDGKPLEGSFVIPKAVVDGSVYIEGLAAMTGATPTTGKFIATTTGDKTTVTVLVADVPLGTEVTVSYKYVIAGALTVTELNGTASATGKLWRILPIYSESSESSAVVGRLIHELGKVKVTAVPGFDNSYKSESSHTVEFTTIASKAVNAVKNKYHVEAL